MDNVNPSTVRQPFATVPLLHESQESRNTPGDVLAGIEDSGTRYAPPTIALSGDAETNPIAGTRTESDAEEARETR